MKLSCFFVCVTVFSVLSSALPSQKVLSRPLPEINPVSKANTYNCYVVTNEGRAFDLTSLCGGNASKTQELLRGRQIINNAGRITPSKKKNQVSNSVSAASIKMQTQQSFQQPSKWGWLPESTFFTTPQQIVSESSNGSSGGSSIGSSGGSSIGASGNCDRPGGTAADGSSCGRRSAESRPGGR